MGLREAWPILSSTVYLALLLTVLGGFTVWWTARRSCAQMGLLSKRRRRYSRKEKDEGGRPMPTSVKNRFLDLDMTAFFAFWVGIAVLAGGLYGINTVCQDLYLDKEKEGYFCLTRTAALPGGQTAVYLANLPNKPEFILFDERGETDSLKRMETYRVLYYPNTRVLISIE